MRGAYPKPAAWRLLDGCQAQYRHPQGEWRQKALIEIMKAVLDIYGACNSQGTAQL